MTEPNYSPARALLRAAKQRPDRDSLVWLDSGEVWSVRRSADAVARTATLLRALGVGEGDRVVYACANSPWVYVLHCACAWIRAVTVPLSERLPEDVAASLRSSLRPRLVLVDRLPGDPGIDEAGAQAPHATGTTLALDDFAARALASPPAGDEPAAVAHEIAAVVHTSGSAGRTRGVELSHACMWWGSMCFRDGFEYSPARDVVGVCAPVSHIGGFNGTTLDVFSHGGALVVFPAFDPGVVLRAIEAHRITMMFVVPVMCHLLLDANERVGADLSSWERPLVGGDAMGPALAERMRAAGLRPIHVWGMTETSGAGLMASPDSGAPAGALGAPFPYVDVRLVAPAGAPGRPGEPVGVGEVGEIEVRGPGVATSFLSAGECGPARIRDGWLATGDLATRDARGWYSIVGRASRMINTGGELVAPNRIEELCRALPQVADALVVGVPDERWGEIVAALLVPAESSPTRPDALDVLAGLRAGLAPWERVRRAVWVDALPQLPNGKPDANAAKRIAAAL